MAKLCLSVVIMEHILWSIVKSDVENDMETEFLVTSGTDSSVRGDDGLS
jgi:hypothetical protein